MVAGAVTGGLFAARSPGPSSPTTTQASALGKGNGISTHTTRPLRPRSPTTTTPPPGPVTIATQAQVNAAVIVPSDFGSLSSGLSSIPAVLCGNYPRPSVYRLAAYSVMPNKTNLGTLVNGAFGYPSAAAAEKALAAIPPTVSGCFPQNATKPFRLRRATGQDLCDQTYLGYADKVEVDKKFDDLFVGIVRCGATLDVFEWLLPALADYEHAAPAFPKEIEGILISSAEKLSHALQ